MREEEILYSAPVEEESPAMDELEIEKTARRYQTGDGVELGALWAAGILSAALLAVLGFRKRKHES